MRPKWTNHRKSYYASTRGAQRVFKIGLHGNVENPNGRYWAAIHSDGTPVESADLGLPYEGLHRFKTKREAMLHLEVFDIEDET